MLKKVLDPVAKYSYNVSSYRGGDGMVADSRAEYFRERRKTRRQFNVMLDVAEYEKLQRHIEKLGMTKTSWFKSLIAKELSSEN